MRSLSGFVLLIAAACSRNPSVSGDALPQSEPSGGAARGRPATGAAPAVAVVELFTSQGCSSCPPADANLARVARDAERDGRRVYALSFHVDYWNYLGWTDPYSSARYSERQRRYAARLSQARVYTPQMVVNGGEELLGSDRSGLDGAIERALEMPSRARIELSAQPEGSKLLVKYRVVPALSDAVVNLAVAERHAKNPVPRGENAGRELVHVDVVRAFEQRADASGEWAAPLPKGLGPDAVRAVAFVQLKDSLKVVAAAAD